MKVKLIAALAFVGACATSCIKDEAPNQECDIREAWVDFSDGKPESVFYSASDAKSEIPGSLDSDVIEFQNVKESVMEFKGILNVKASDNSKVFMQVSEDKLVLVDGKIETNFKVGDPVVFFVVAEDEPELMTANAAKLLEASFTDRHVRRYVVQFNHTICITQFHFNSFEQNGKYYEWSDLMPNGKKLAVPNWGTANGGFGLARSSAKPEEYPTVPYENGKEGYGVKLETCSTGSFGQMTNKPLAAGNLFLGTFDLQTALKEPLTSTRFGVRFSKYPVRFVGYYRYLPGEQMRDGKGNAIEGTDAPSIYAILYKNHDANGKPATVNGATVDDSELIVARAEVMSFKNNTEDWQKFDVEFEYKKEIDLELLRNNGYNISIVCSSSRGGATYQGAIGSKLLVDEFEIICKDY